jgi:hypothetical protein
MKLTAELNPEGPASYENMKAAQNAMAPLLVTEVPLYSDAYFTDEFISPDSPFSLINPYIDPTIIPNRCHTRQI